MIHDDINVNFKGDMDKIRDFSNNLLTKDILLFSIN